MARTRLLLPAGRKRKRRFYEQCYVASAKAYVLSPELLGRLAADAGTMPDRLSAGHLLGLAAQMQKEVNRAMDLTPGGKKVATLSLNGEVRFTSADQRVGFTRALEKAIVDVVGKHTSPFQLKDGSPAPGRAFRIVLGCYPIAAENDNEWRGERETGPQAGGWKDVAASPPGRRSGCREGGTARPTTPHRQGRAARA